MVTAFQRGLTGPIGYRQVKTLELLEWGERIDRTVRANRRAVRYCMFVGICLDSLVLLSCIVGNSWLAARGRRPAEPAGAAVFGGLICALMLVVASFTKPESRADVANQLIDNGFQNGRSQGHPFVSIIVIALMITALFGSYCIVESIRRTWVRRKLARVDRCEMARLLAQVAATPTGVPVQLLLKANQSVKALRAPVAALMLDGWVVLREGGRVVEQRAQSDLVNGWKHPLVDIFGG